MCNIIGPATGCGTQQVPAMRSEKSVPAVVSEWDGAGWVGNAVVDHDGREADQDDQGCSVR